MMLTHTEVKKAFGDLFQAGGSQYNVSVQVDEVGPISAHHNEVTVAFSRSRFILRNQNGVVMYQGK